MRKQIYISILLLLASAAPSMAQAVVGPEAIAPQEFSVLEIISNDIRVGGLRMPQLTTQERDDLTATAEFQAAKELEARGLTIYNKDTDCIEFWNGENWISTCAGENCPTPDMPEDIIFSKPGPLRLNETFTAEVPAIAGLTYTWTIPASFVLEGSSANDNPITLRAVTPGIHSLYNIGVTATNECGNTGASRPGNGYIQVLNCETEPQPGDIDLSNVVVSLTTGSGTQADPYQVEVGNSFTISYTDTGNGLIKYSFNLNQEGSEYFSVVTQGNGTILLTAKSIKEGEPACTGEAIGIIASNECGDGQRVASGIYIRIVSSGGSCPKPDAPDEIIFSKTTVLVNEIFTARVATPDDAMTYTWSVPEELQVVGSNTGNAISLRAKKEGTINLVGVSVTATNDCGNTSDPTNGSGILTVKTPTNIPEGSGSLRGRTCFDIAYSNSGGSCGEPNGRQSNKTDFSIRTEQDPAEGYIGAPYSGVQVYTYTPPPGVAVSNIRYVVDDPSGLAVEKYEPHRLDEAKLIVYFKESLNETLRGLTRENALKVHIYAIYEESGQEKSVKLTLSLQDCACCGARIAGGRWLNFMCHNLGADENLDPFTYHAGLKGYLYQWGRKSDKHQIRTSTKVSGIAESSELDANGQVQGRKTGQFIMFVYGRKIVSDWRTPSDNNLWSDANRTVNDPCPPGWRVPTAAQWQAVISNNQWVWDGKGRKVGNALYLPAAGSRSARPGTSITSDPESARPNAPYGYYWSSTGEYNSYWQVYVAHQLGFSSGIRPYVSTNDGTTYRNWGQSVRCVEDLP